MTELGLSRPSTPAGIRLVALIVRPWRDRLGLVGLALLVAQGVWRGVLLGQGYFTQDDFLMMHLAGRGISPAMLVQDYSGHLFPGGFLIAWIQVSLAPLNWSFSVFVVMVMQLAAGAMMWLALRRLLNTNWIIASLFAVFLFCPITLWPTQWWAVAIQFLPVSFFLCLSVWAFLLRVQEGARWGGPVAILATVGALLFQERGLLIPVVLAFVAIAQSPVAPWSHRVWQAIRAHWPLWGVLVVLDVAYLIAHRQISPITTSPVDSVTEVIQLIGNFLGRNLLVGMFGGSWTRDILDDSLVTPSWWAVGVCLMVLLALVAWSVRRGGFMSACGWILIGTYGMVDATLLFAGRAGSGPSYGLIPRYAADAVPAVVIGLAIVASGASRSRTVEWTVPKWVPYAVLTVAYLASAAVSTTFMAPHQFNSQDRTYVERIRSQLRAEPQTVLYDTRVPDGIMIFWFGEDARLSTVLGDVPEAPVFDVPSYQLRMADTKGYLRPIDLVNSASSKKVRKDNCGYHATSAGVDIPLRHDIEGDRMVMRIGYYSGRTGFAEVSAGDSVVRVPIRRGLQSVDLLVSGAFDRAHITFEREGTVCVPAVVVGYPVPRE